jgi:Mg2+/Co2+ transporter CorB
VLLYREDIGNVLGILHLRKVSQFMHGDRLDREAMQRAAAEPYFVPEGTPLNTQLLNFQKLKRRIGIVVDEYGSVRGLVTLEDILEEIVGEFTSNISEPVAGDRARSPTAACVIDGGTAIRDDQPLAALGAAGRRTEDPQRPDRRVPGDDSGSARGHYVSGVMTSRSSNCRAR